MVGLEGTLLAPVPGEEGCLVADAWKALRERIEQLGRMNTIYSERDADDWKPGDPPKHDHYTHGAPRKVDDEHPDLPDRD